MMKKVWVALLTLVMGLSLSGMALAQGTPGGKAVEPAKPMAPADKPAEKSGAAKEAKGKVVSVNPGNKTFVVEAEGKRMTFSVAEPAAKTLPTIKRGDQVTVRYTEDGGKLMAQGISKG